MSKVDRKTERERELIKQEAIARKSINAYFTLRNRRFIVTKVSSFNGVIHYGFISADTENFICGWIPVELAGQCELSK